MGIGDRFALLLAVVFWASSFAAIRFAVADLGAGHLTLLRFLVASLVMAVYLVASRAKVPPMRDLAALGGLGFLGISIYHFGLNWGETQVEAGTASLLVATETGWMAVFAWFYLRERPTARIWAGVMLSMVAAGLIVYGQGQRLGGRMAHCLAVFGAAVSVSLFSVLQRRLVAQYGALQFSAWTVIGGTVPFLIFWPGLAETVRHAKWAALASVVYLAIFPGLVGYVVWARTVARIPISQAASYLYLLPPFALGIGWIWLGETPGIWSLAGGAVALAGMALVNQRQAPARAASASEKAAAVSN